MSFYKHHVFFFLNKRDPPEACCANHGADGMKDYAKKRVKELKLNGAGKVRINAAGCLDRQPGVDAAEHLRRDRQAGHDDRLARDDLGGRLHVGLDDRVGGHVPAAEVLLQGQVDQPVRRGGQPVGGALHGAQLISRKLRRPPSAA